MADLTVTHSYIDKNGEKQHRFTITCNNPEWHGHQTSFELYRFVEVKDSRPVNKESKRLTRKITLNSSQPVHIDIPINAITIYPYKGSKINISIQSRVKVPRKWMMDKKIKHQHYIQHKQPKYSHPKCAEHVMDPKDSFDLLKNLSALAPQNQLMAFLLLVTGAVLILINTIIGIHDQMVPEMQTWLYSHYNSDGESSSPLVQSLVGSGGLGAAIWFMLKKQLRKYMQFHFRQGQIKVRPNTDYMIKKMVTGKSRVDLKNITLRIVAANVEHGTYIRGSGSNRRQVDFSNPVNGITLYQEFISHIPAKMPIDDYISSKTFTFDALFEKLYPPQMLGKDHGLDLSWEVQLIHQDFIDQELIGAKHIFKTEDFWNKTQDATT